MKLDSVFNQPLAPKLQGQFVRETVARLQSAQEVWLRQNLSRLLKKDKTLVKEAGLHGAMIVRSQLDALWDGGFELGTARGDFALEEGTLSYFEVGTKSQSAQELKSRSTREKTRTAQQGISKTDFGETYLRYRNQEVARNFTASYSKRIQSSVKDYVESDVNLATTTNKERALINRLSLKRFQDLTVQERKELLPLLNQKQLKEVQKHIPAARLKEVRDTYGLRNAIVENPEAYDSAFYKYNLTERVDRIAQTEINAAYNLGRLSEQLDTGRRFFTWRTSGRENCVLCESLDYTLIDLGGMDLSRVYTDFRRVNTKRPTAGQQTSPYPPVHPYCDCYFTPVETEQDLLKLQSAGKVPPRQVEEVRQSLQGNTQSRMAQVAQSVAKSSVRSLISQGIMTAGQKGYNYARTRARLKEMEEQRERSNVIKLAIIGSSILSIGLMYHLYVRSRPQVRQEIIKAVRETVAATGEEFLQNRIDDALDVVEEIVVPPPEERDEVERLLQSKELERAVQEQEERLALRRQAREVSNSLRQDVEELDAFSTQLKLINAELTGITRKRKNLQSLLDDPDQPRSDLVDELAQLNTRLQRTVRDVEGIQERLGVNSPLIQDINRKFKELQSLNPSYKFTYKGKRYNPNVAYSVTKHFRESNLRTKLRQEQRLIDLMQATLDTSTPDFSLFDGSVSFYLLPSTWQLKRKSNSTTVARIGG